MTLPFKINPLPPSDAVQQQKNLFQRIFQFSIVTVLKISPYGYLKVNYLGISQSLKLRFVM